MTETDPVRFDTGGSAARALVSFSHRVGRDAGITMKKTVTNDEQQVTVNAVEPWLTTEAIAIHLGGVDVSTVQRWCVEGKMPHVRANARGRILSKASWVDAWLIKRGTWVEQEAA